MSYVIDFVKTFPGLSAGVAFTLVMLPWIIELFETVMRLRAAMGQ